MGFCVFYLGVVSLHNLGGGSGEKWSKSAAKNLSDFAADLYIIFHLCSLKSQK